MDVVDADGLRAVPLHCQYSWMDDRGTRASALADLRIDAHCQRRLSARGGGQCLVHADRLYGDVHGVDLSLAVPGLPRNRTWTGTERASEKRRCCRAGGRLKKARWERSGSRLWPS